MNTAGSFYCACSDELVLASDQRTCVSRDLRCRALEVPRHAEASFNYICIKIPSVSAGQNAGSK